MAMRRPRSRTTLITTALAAGPLVLTAGVTAPATAGSPAQPVTDRGGHSDGFYTAKTAIRRGSGGAVSSVDPEATRIGVRVLRDGGNAVDAAVATAAALGVTEPYSAGIGGGGYFVHYSANSGKVRVIDGRETAPESMPNDAFIDPESEVGEPYNFTPELVTSGVSVGVPGTLATWKTALDRWGSRNLGSMLRPAASLAERGFVVDEAFELQTAENQQRFEAYTSSPELFLPGGELPEAGSVFKNPDLARTYRLIGKRGTGWFYRGGLAREISEVVQAPPVSPTTDLPVPAGYLEPSDLAGYRTIVKRPTKVSYRGYQVYGMPPSSSGGTTIGESLNILEELRTWKMPVPRMLHHYFEATALAYADRAAYLGDAAYTPVPVRRLLSQRFAAERACEIDPDEAAVKPVASQDVTAYDGVCDPSGPGTGERRADTENRETTNLTVADRWGNVVEYTLTIEQTGGSGMVVPGRGFLLNNELTDFSTVYDPEDPNRIEGGKRPRSSMSPTIVLRHNKPFLALGSPGGASIITTVLQVILNRVDRGMPLLWAVAAPRASQRNSASVSAEQQFIDRWGDPLGAFGHTFAAPGLPGTSAAEIGAVTAIEFRGRHGLIAVAEPERRGGGAALVVNPRRGR